MSFTASYKRIFTIESGSRELSLVSFKKGKVVNNVVHTLSRPSDNPAYDITQEDLVVASLRFNPDIVVVGEMRDTEAYSAVEASLTGHTVVSTVHASAADAALRQVSACQSGLSALVEETDGEEWEWVAFRRIFSGGTPVAAETARRTFSPKFR